MDMNQLLEQGIYKAPKKVVDLILTMGRQTTIASDGGELGNGLGSHSDQDMVTGLMKYMPRSMTVSLQGRNHSC